MAATRKQLALSFLVFALFAIIGALSAKYDESFVRIAIPGGDAYVDMTLENIHKGEPMAVYGQSEDRMDVPLYHAQQYPRFADLFAARHLLLRYSHCPHDTTASWSAPSSTSSTSKVCCAKAC